MPSVASTSLRTNASKVRVRPPLHLLFGRKARDAWVATDLVRGDIFYWGELMAAALIASVPVAIAYNLFLDRFISGITGGAVK
jgi:ABC-type glycerol-3-phosphate transport system permease component